MLAQRSLPFVLKQTGHDVLQEQTGCHYAQRVLFMTGNETGIDVVHNLCCGNHNIFEHFTVRS